jgi:hypothetical protein
LDLGLFHRQSLNYFYLAKIGKPRIIYYKNYEREFNHQAGFTNVDERFPEWMYEEPLPPHNTIYDVSVDEMDKFF